MQPVECLTRRDPFEGQPPFQVVFAVGTQGARPECDGLVGPLVAMMRRCWVDEATARPAFPELVEDLDTELNGAYPAPTSESLSAIGARIN